MTVALRQVIKVMTASINSDVMGVAIHAIITTIVVATIAIVITETVEIGIRYHFNHLNTMRMSGDILFYYHLHKDANVLKSHNSGMIYERNQHHYTRPIALARI